MQIAVLGAGGHGQVIASVLALDSEIEYKYFDDWKDYPDFSAFLIDDWKRFIVAIGDNSERAKVFYIVNKIKTPQTVFHPSVMIPFPRVIGEGTFVNAGVIINTGAKIGDNVILNTGCIVEHHCIIHNHAHIAPGAVLCGGVEIGEGALVGAGAVVLPGVRVPEWSTVGAGSIVE